jgi:AraC-like DNA-binding protein
VSFLSSVARGAGGFGAAAATTLRTRSLGSVQLAQIKAPSARDDRGDGYVDPYDSIVWAFVTRGAISSRFARHEVENATTGMSVSHMPRLAGFQMTPDFRSVSIRMDPRALEISSSEIDRISRTVFPLGDGLPRMMASMASSALRMGDDLGTASARALAQSIVDLTQGFVDDLLERPQAPGSVAAAHVQQAREHVLLRYADPDLSVQSVADRLGVSPRTLRKAFEREGTSLSGEIARTRLARARALLARPGEPAVSVEAVAARSGFRSASSFSPSFRAAHAVSPREYRDAALRSPLETSADPSRRASS